MKNVAIIFITDLRHLMKNIIAAIIVIGLVLVPPMYAWFTTLGFWDPYSNTGNLSVGVASSDEGYKSELFPLKINVGNEIEDTLRANSSFDWQFVNESEAVDGVKSGKYYAAIVIPANFSESLLNAFSNKYQPAEIVYYTNEKENAIANKITDTGATTLKSEIDETFAKTVADVALDMTSGLSSFMTGNGIEAYARNLQSQLDNAADTLRTASALCASYSKIVASAGDLINGAANLIGDVNDEGRSLAAKANEAKTKLEEAEESLKSTYHPSDIENVKNILNDAIDKLDAALQEAESVVGANETINRALALANEAKTTLDNAQSIYNNNVAPSIANLESTSAQLSSQASSMISILESAGESISGSASGIGNGIGSVNTLLGDISTILDSTARSFSDTSAKLSDALSKGDIDEVQRIIGSNPETLASLLVTPTTVVKHAVWGMPNNGSAMSPFYTSLALWIGAIFLVALTSVNITPAIERRLKNPKPWQLYLGRYLIFGLFGIAQATVLGIGNVFFLGIECQHFWLYILACWIIGIVFTNLVYTLTISFGNVGKAIAIILLVLQLAGSGGIFPVQMSAEFFQWIYPWLPFAHSMEALESAMVGIWGMQYVHSIGLLATLLIPSLILGLVLRRPIISMNEYFEAKLDETKLV